MTEQEKYLEGHRNCGIKVGDRVRVTRKAEDGENGWDNVWGYNADNAIGELGVVSLDGDDGGFLVHSDKDSMHAYPYFVLEKI